MMPYLVRVLRSALARYAALFACALSIVFTAPAVAASPSAIVAYYNALRSANGIPGDLALDTASSAKCALHNHYAALNGNDSPNPHQETPGKPGYTTGGDWAARNSELAGGSGLVSAFAPFDRGRPYWSAPFVNAPFHLMGLLNPSNTTLWGADTEGGLCIGEGGARPAPAADTLYSFPGTGTSIPWAQRVQGEYPTSPVVVAGMPDGSLTGPLLIAFWRGPSDASDPPLDALTSATLTGPSGQVPTDVVSTQQSDLVAGGAGFVIPTSPLQPGAHYTASVTFSTAPDALTHRSWSRSFSFTTTGPPSASSLVHIAAVTQPRHTVVFAMTADFPATGEPATLSVKSSNPLLRIKGGTGPLPGYPVVNVYPLASPEPGGWLRLSLAVPAYTVSGVRVRATTVSKTVTGPPLASLLVGLRPRRSYSTNTVAGPGIELSLRVKRPGTQLQAALKQGRQIYAVTPRLKVGRSGRVKLVLRAPASLLGILLGGHRSARATLALRILEPGVQMFEIDRSVTITR
jgi:hypothetical protein